MKLKLSALPMLLLLVAASGCADLSEIQDNVCGNGVVDPHEDCDSSSPACGATGRPEACRWTCASDQACPSGFACGTDMICRAAGSALLQSSSPAAKSSRVIDIADFDGDGFGDVLAAHAGENAVYYHAQQAVQTGAAVLPSRAEPSAGILTDTPVGVRPHASFVVARNEISVTRGQAGRTLEPKSYSRSRSMRR